MPETDRFTDPVPESDGLHRPTREEAIQRAAQALARCTPIPADKLAPSRAELTSTEVNSVVDDLPRR